MLQMKRRHTSQSWSALLMLVALLAGLGAEDADAASISIESAGKHVIVVVDEGEQSETPVTLKDLSPGIHTLGFRATPFGPVLFSEVLALEEDMVLYVTVDVPARKASVKRAGDEHQQEEVGQPLEGPSAASEAAVRAPDLAAPIPDAVPEDPTPPRTPVGDLYVEADIEGAQILVDGADTGHVTPAMLRDLPLGRHEVIMSTECGRARGEVEIREGLIQRLELVLRTGGGSLSISTVPAGAVLLLDGEDIGSSPKVIKYIECGEHALVVRAPGFLEKTHSFRTPAFEITTVVQELIEETYGMLVVAPTPLGAQILVDGVAAGKGPMTIEGVGSGTHRLEISAEGYQPWVNDIDIHKDQVTRLDMALFPEEQKRGMSNLPWGRLALDTGVTGGGLVLGVLALSDYGKARDAFQVFLDEPDDDVAEAYFDEEVRPIERRAAVEGVGGVALLGLGTALWVTTDLQVSFEPNTLGLHYRW